jgi:hypothetical protein
MRPVTVIKNGFVLRALKCQKCGDKITHPGDEREYEEFQNIRNKRFRVKLRLVGNSYAVSIPKEIVDFMREQEKIMNDLVSLSFESARKISLIFENDE